MCGIAGVFRPRGPISETDRSALARMLATIQHRGPDDEGVYEARGLLLGHRRLSILDLSKAGHQPMTNDSADVWLSYNGEVYNFRELRDELTNLGHRFRSRTDAEVIVRGYEAWGLEGLLEKLRGMFAFALYDARGETPQLFLVRDRFGIKPLYYAIVDDAVVFASEVSTIAGSGLIEAAPSSEALASFLALGSVPGPGTAIRGVTSVPAGHYFDGDTLTRYWRLSRQENEGSEIELGELLREVVRMHLVSDVPLGVFSSGGIDSASLVALASQSSEEPITTLSVVLDDAELDESVYARRVAERYRTEHREVHVTGKDFLDALPGVFESMDQPSIDGVNSFLVSRAAKQAGLTVVLSGLGGDEVFLGYPHFRKIRALSRLRPLLRPAHSVLSRITGLPAKADYFENPTPENVYLAFRGLFSPKQVAQLLPGIEPFRLDPVEGDMLDVAVELELAYYLHNQLLRDTDAMSMANSVEVRVPFLDHRLVEAMARVPHAKKLRGRRSKALLLDAVGDSIPRAVWDRPKQGFTLPFRRWMLSHRGELEERTEHADAFDRASVRSVWNDFVNGRLHWSRPWALLAYGEWLTRLGERAMKSEHEPARVAR
jgi:asparagine synthase (glutamine-hydrolysing)